jgi:hypothetical protein
MFSSTSRPSRSQLHSVSFQNFDPSRIASRMSLDFGWILLALDLWIFFTADA